MAFSSLCKYEIGGKPNGLPFNGGLSLLVSLVIATGVMRSKLKSVRSRTGAREYTRPAACS